MTDSVPRGGGRKAKPPYQRFWVKVDRRGPDECWAWTGALTNGYGSFRIVAGKTVSAHSYAKQLATGVTCPAGLNALHVCKTPTSTVCCNPDHIIYAQPGTTTIAVRGIAHPRTKLTDDQVEDIRRRALAGERNVDLAHEFDIAPQYVSHLKCGHSRASTRP